MGKDLRLEDLVAGNPKAAQELTELIRIAIAAKNCVSNPEWPGICDEDIELELAVDEAEIAEF